MHVRGAIMADFCFAGNTNTSTTDKCPTSGIVCLPRKGLMFYDGTYDPEDDLRSADIRMRVYDKDCCRLGRKTTKHLTPFEYESKYKMAESIVLVLEESAVSLPVYLLQSYNAHNITRYTASYVKCVGAIVDVNHFLKE